MRLRLGYPAVLALTLLIWSGPALEAQVSGANIAGTITDSSGSVIPKARVEITNRGTGVKRVVTANSEGFFTAPNLLPGDYQVAASSAGFGAKGVNLTLNVGDDVTVPLQLAVGEVSATVEIVDAPPSVELSSSSLSAVVQGPVIRDLPLNGRSWTDLAALQPGVAPVSTQIGFDQGAGRGNRGFGAQISISGGRPSQNSYRLDGISINDYANSGPGSVLGTNLGVDAIAEFSVITNSYSAEYGKTSGGVINAITRTGTNQIHGSAYAFFRNSALDARNYFDVLGGKAIAPPPFSRYQYGGSAGGPIRTDRTFFFGDFEAIRQSLANTASVNVLSNAARARATDPAVIKYLGLFPIANVNVNTTTDVAGYTFVKQEEATENFFTTRIDHKITNADSIFGTYLYDDNPFTIGDAQNLVLQSSKVRRQDLILEETHIVNSSFTNSVRFGLNRQAVSNNFGLTALNPLAADTSLGIIAGRTAPGVNVPGLDRVVGGVGSSPSYLFRFTTFQGYDDAFLTRGKHNLKFGVAYERLQNNIRALSNPNGLFNFGSTATLINNVPKKLQAGIASTLTPRNLRQSLFAGYLEDDWHALPNLTLNLGLRYESTTVPTEVAGKLSALRNITDAQPHLGDPYFNDPTHGNIEPRFGFAWDPFPDHKTSVRGGYGLYDVLPLLYEFEILSVLTAPYFEIGSTSNAAVKLGADPTLVAGALTASPTSLGQAFIQPSPKRNDVMQFNFTVQHEIRKGTTLTVGYVGSRGFHLPFRVEDANIVLPTKTAQGYLWPTGGGVQVNPNVGTIRALWWNADSYYNALNVNLVAQVTRGLHVQSAFTWGKSLDDNSATIAGDTFGNSVPSLDWYDPHLNYGRSDFDLGKVSVTNVIYAVPVNRNLAGASALALNGWQVGGIYRQSTGTPFTPLIGGDPLGKLGSDPWDYPDRVAGCDPINHNYRSNGLAYVNIACFPRPGGNLKPIPQLRGNASRNVITGPSLSDLDVSVFKNNYVPRFSEVFNIQLRAELFNVLNHANFSPPNNTNQQIYDGSLNQLPTAGVLSSPTATTSRQLQLAAKIIF